jgi:hypothetical protein
LPVFPNIFIVDILQLKIEEVIRQFLAQHDAPSCTEQILLLKRLLTPYPSLASTVKYISTETTFNQVIEMQEEEQWIKSKSTLVLLLRTVEESFAVPAPGRTLFNLVCNIFRTCIY